ncbi:uncharacterized protein LODBEIA_P37540 [Lodderomyces beijingensis]|uniref:Repressor of RNA polymerase III transcription MAF1 n=1 Tax=Lodderomyces beijingensis TaxID=1775926 RepID=A0ABP0ZQR4_9ASCO
MKYIDEIDLELVNQELNFSSPDNNLVIKGGCELFTTKPIGSDRKLFKTIDKHLNQIIEDNQLSRSLEKERQSSINSIFGASGNPTGDQRGLQQLQWLHQEKQRRSSSVSSRPNFNKDPIASNGSSTSLLSTSLNEDSAIEPDQHAVDESPFGPLKNTTTRRTFAYLIAILNNTFPDQNFSDLQPTTENFYKLDSPEDLVQKFNNLLTSLGKKEDILNWIWDIINSYMDVIPSKNSSPALAATVGTSHSYGHSNNHNNNNGHGSRKGSLSNSRNGSMTTLTDATTTNTSPSSHLGQYENCQIYQFQPSDESIFEDLTYPYQPMWSYYWFIYNKKKKRVTFLHLTAINKAHFANVNAKSNRKTSSSDPVISGGDDEEEYDENDEYANNEEFVADSNPEENGDVVGDLEI